MLLLTLAGPAYYFGITPRVNGGAATGGGGATKFDAMWSALFDEKAGRCTGLVMRGGGAMSANERRAADIMFGRNDCLFLFF